MSEKSPNHSNGSGAGRGAGARCPWAGSDPCYQEYHDREWGRPQRDPVRLFELLCLEGFQAGLSWLTVLRKRARLRDAFADFDPDALLRFGEAEVAALLQDPGIIRHRGKIEAVLGNARAWSRLQGEPGGFAGFVWSFVGDRPLQHRYERLEDVPVRSAPADALAKALMGTGFRFVGPTLCQSFMQAAGLMNDHLLSCPQHAACAREAGL